MKEPSTKICVKNYEIHTTLWQSERGKKISGRNLRAITGVSAKSNSQKK